MNTLSVRNLILTVFLIFSIKQSFSQNQNLFRNYQEGRYYDLAGVKHVGFIDFGSDFWGNLKINFKIDTLKSKNQRIDIKDIKCLVIYHEDEFYSPAIVTDNQNDTAKTIQMDQATQPKMVPDSLVVFKEVNDNSINPIKFLLWKFVTEAVQSKIYMREESRMTTMTTSGFGMQTFGYSSTVTIYMCEINGNAITLNRSNFKETLSSAFADDDELVAKIRSKEYRFGKMENIIDDYLSFKSKFKK